MPATNLLDHKVPIFADSENSPHNFRHSTAFFLCLFAGLIGAHRFYLQRYKTGVLFALTIGFFGFGYVYDILMLSMGLMKDSQGIPVRGDEEVILIGLACVVCVVVSSAMMLVWVFR